MNTRMFFGMAGLALSAMMLSACAASVCERKRTFMNSRCAGGSVAYDGEPMCEARTQNCSPAQKAQLEGYVSCLEEGNQCSMEALAACAKRFPGGVNLACGPV